MLFSLVMIRYGELSLKGKNKRQFIDTLATNIMKTFKDMPDLKFVKQHDRFYIELNENSNIDEIISRVKMIPGIFNCSLVSKVNKNIDDIKNVCLEIIKSNFEGNETFKVITNRADKTFELDSNQINREVASIILKNTNHKVDVHNPQINVKVEIRYDFAYISIKNYPCLGGFPLGINGKGMLMISGGIDSVVAGHMVQKKGLKVEAIHFSSPPYTSDMAVYKVKTLLSKLAKIQGEVKFINVPFTDLQLEIYKQCGDVYAITIMRRMMYRLASYFASEHKCNCIVNGESIGQVASQTLESMGVINEVTNKVIIRPLATMDKQEIINIAKAIDTFETSILPYEDCCTIFDPKNPTTRPKLEKCEYYEAKFDYQKMLEDAISKTTIEIIKND